jgi:hypothetical protein
VADGALIVLRDTWHAAEPAMSDAVLAIGRERAAQVVAA